MKKTFILILAGLLVMGGLSAQAFGKKKANLEILPTMETTSTAANQVWVGTFQLIWNDLINEIIKNPIEFVGQKSIIAEQLNKQNFTTTSLSENSYYKKWGKTSPALKKEIEQGIKEKFNETSDILDGFDWTAGEGRYTLYAMLKKDFEYPEAFNKLDNGTFKGSKGKVAYFGMKKDAPSAMRENVHVLFYNNSNDYAVSIATNGADRIYLYRTNDKKNLNDLYWDMMKKYRISTSNPRFTDNDELKVPVIDFKTEKEFNELCNKQIKGTDLIISKAIETIDFKMNNKGVKLKSEAGMAVKCLALAPERTEPRKFYFDNTYVIFLQEKDKPYFAMRVTDAKKLQK